MYRAAASFNLWAIKVAEKRALRKADHQSTHYTYSHPDGPRLAHKSSTIGSRSVLDLSEADMEAANEDPLPEEGHYDSESEGSSDDSSADEDPGFNGPSSRSYKKAPVSGIVTVSGIEPAFVNSIIRERVSTTGRIRAMEPESEIEALNMPIEQVGVISQRGPAKKWLAKRAEWDQKFAKELNDMRKNKEEDRKLAEKEGFLTRDLHGERPPLSAAVAWSVLVARLRAVLLTCP